MSTQPQAITQRQAPPVEPFSLRDFLSMSAVAIALTLIGRIATPVDQFGVVLLLEHSLLSTALFRHGTRTFLALWIITLGAHILASAAIEDLGMTATFVVSAISGSLAWGVNQADREDFDTFYQGFTRQLGKAAKVWMGSYIAGGFAIYLTLSMSADLTPAISLHQLVIVSVGPLLVVGLVQCAFGIPRETWKARWKSVGIPQAVIAIACAIVFYQATNSTRHHIAEEQSNAQSVATDAVRTMAFDRQIMAVDIRDAFFGAEELGNPEKGDGAQTKARTMVASLPEVIAVGLLEEGAESFQVLAASQPYGQAQEGLPENLWPGASPGWEQAQQRANESHLVSCFLINDDTVGAITSGIHSASQGPSRHVFYIFSLEKVEQEALEISGSEGRYKVVRAAGSQPPASSQSNALPDARCQHPGGLHLERASPPGPKEMEPALRWLSTTLLLLVPIGLAIYADAGRRLIAEDALAANHRMHDDLVKTQSRLETAERGAVIGSTVSALTHELNTPLMSALISTQLIDRKLAAAVDGDTAAIQKARRLTAGIRASIQRAADVMNNLKTAFSEQTRAASSEFLVLKRINELVSTEIKPRLANHNQTIAVEGDETISITSAPRLLEHVINNLAMNALRHGFPNDEPGEITITVHEAGEWCLIDCRDNGAGIPKSIQSSIFEQGFTTYDSRRKSPAHAPSIAENAGMGLYISRTIVRGQLGGNLLLLPSDRGAHFQIHIPKKQNKDNTTIKAT